MADAPDDLEICLYGPFAVRTRDGAEITPRGKKAGAVVVLLAECDTGKRTRRWIERMLWSDRGSEQARGSLRQTLFELRKQLGAFGDVIRSDRTAIWLDPARVRVTPPVSGRAFLEGFDAPDPEFRDWLTRKRLAYGRPVPAVPNTAGTLRIQCGLPWTRAHSDPVAAQVVSDQVGGIISGFIARSSRSVLEREADLVVRASLDETGDAGVIAVQIIDARHDLLIHTDHVVIDDLAALLKDETPLGRFCWQVADAALEALALSNRHTDAAAMRAAWSQDAVRAVLTFDGAVMPKSLNILDEAEEHLDDGLFHALRGWAMMSLIMEGRLEETGETLAATRATLDRALRLTGHDPMVGGLAANVHALLFEDFAEAQRLAVTALKGQPSNVFATQALSLTRFNKGAHDLAYDLSRKNRDVALTTKYGAMCNLHHALLCLRLRRSDEAIVAAREAADAVPAYRAPSRQLIALYASQGQMKAATEQAAALGRFEPGFTLDRLLYDPDYPANTLRETGMLSAAARRLAEGS